MRNAVLQQVENLHRIHRHAEHEKIKSWCRSLGPKNQYWMPLLTFYNSGRRLFATANVDPRVVRHFDRNVEWKWLKFREWNPFYGSNQLLHQFSGIEVGHFGHDRASRVRIGIQYDMNYHLVIPPYHCLHLIETISGPEFNLQFLYLPNWFFHQALVRP